MDNKTIVKEEVLATGIGLRNAKGFSLSFVATAVDNAAVCSNGSERGIKTEVKENSLVSDPKLNEENCPSAELAVKINNTAIFSDCKIEIREEALDSSIGLQNREHFSSLDVTKMDSNDLYSDFCGMDTKIDIKEEPLWLGGKSLEVMYQPKACPIYLQNEIMEGMVEDFLPAESQRSFTDVASKASKITPALFTTEGPGDKDIFKMREASVELGEASLLKVHRNYVMEKSCTKQNAQLKVNDNSKKLHKCKICEKSFAWKKSLKIHILIHEGKRPYKCEICKSFTQKGGLKSHMLIHEGKKPHKCEICEKSFSLRKSLKTHTLINEGKRPHKCEICKKSFTQRVVLKTHIMLIHEDKKPYKCELCGKSFSGRASLKTHILIHEGKRPYKCEICAKSFTQRGGLKTHMLNHEGKRPYNCGMCEKSFNSRISLKSHISIHEGKRPYQCKICEKGFTRKGSLKTHLLLHESLGPYSCKLCEIHFTSRTSMNTHIFIHEGKRLYKCDSCEKSFTCKKSLKTHFLIH